MSHDLYHPIDVSVGIISSDIVYEVKKIVFALTHTLAFRQHITTVHILFKRLSERKKNSSILNEERRSE